MGIERLVPMLDDLALFLSLLPRSATGQKLSVYTSLIHSPRRPTDPDGPLERHLILVDNGRSNMSTSPLAEALFCIRCGACLNACPVFRELSGHAYLGRDGSIAPYPGPIGSVVSPGLFGCENFGHLAQASSLCGACKEACPVDIDLPGMLLRVRAGETTEAKGRKQNEGVGIPTTVKLGLKGFRLAAESAGFFAFFQKLGGLFSRIYSPRHAYMHIPAWTGWGYSKDFPRLTTRSFRSRWQGIQQEIQEGTQGTTQTKEVATIETQIRPSLVAQFTEELTALGGKVTLVKEKDLPGKLSELLASRNMDSVLADAEGAQYLVSHPGEIKVIREPDPKVRCGVTGTMCGIADTGSLVLVGGTGRPLTASLLPEIHIAVLKTSRILPTLAEALREPELHNTAAGVVITGPSRTADIEMTLTIGVHGPGELHVFLIDDSTGV
jgi:L-lactate dehydrogenase complex protein LldF